MVLQLVKWDDSVALLLPADIARRIHAKEGARFDLTIDGGRVVLTPLDSQTCTLEELLAGVTEENLHGETRTAVAVGNEFG